MAYKYKISAQYDDKGNKITGASPRLNVYDAQGNKITTSTPKPKVSGAKTIRVHNEKERKKTDGYNVLDYERQSPETLSASLDSWLTDYNAYLESSNNRYSNRQAGQYVGDAAAYYVNTQREGQRLLENAKQIVADATKAWQDERIAEEDYLAIKGLVTSYEGQYGDIVDTAKLDADYWAQFDDENQYTTWYRRETMNLDEQQALIDAKNAEIKAARRELGSKSNIQRRVGDEDAIEAMKKERADLETEYELANRQQYGRQAAEFVATLDPAIKSEMANILDEEQTVYDATMNTVGRMRGHRRRKKLADKLGLSLEELDEQISYYEWVRNNDRAVQAQEYFQQLADKNPAWASVVSVGMNTVSGFGVLNTAEQILDRTLTGSDRPIDVNTPANRPGQVTQTIRGTVGEGIAEDTFFNHLNVGDTNVGTFLYDTAMSGVDSAVNTAIATAVASGLGATGATANTIRSAVTSMLTGSQVASTSLAEQIVAGVPAEEALAMATLEGAIEGATEHINIDVAMDALLSGKSTWATLARSFASEGGEELAANVLNRAIQLAEYNITGREPEFVEAYNRYREQGDSDSRAFAKVLAEMAGEDVSAILAGGLVGMVYGAGQAIATDTQSPRGQTRIVTNQALKEQRKGENDIVTGLIESGLEADPNSEAHRLASEAQAKLDGKQSLSRAEIRALIAANEQAFTSEGEVKPEAKTVPEPTASEEAKGKYGAMTKVFENGRLEDQDETAYTEEWDLAYNYGIMGVNPDYATDVSKYRTLNAEQIQKAYEAGATFAPENRTAKAQRIAEYTRTHATGSVSFDGGTTASGINLPAVSDRTMKHLSAEQKATVSFLQSVISEASGLRVSFFESAADAQGKYSATNGLFDKTTDTIYVDINGKKLSTSDTKAMIGFVAAHELTHFAEKWGGNAYADYSKLILDRLAAADGISLNERVQTEQARQYEREVRSVMQRFPALTRQQAEAKVERITFDAAVSEIVARASEEVFTNTDLAKEIRRKDASLYEKIKETISAIIKRLRALLSGNTEMASAEAQSLSEYIEEISKAWDVTVASAVENYRSATLTTDTSEAVNPGEEVEYSLRMDEELMAQAEAVNADTKFVAENVLSQAGKDRQRIKALMEELDSKLALPDDIPGRTLFGNASYGGSLENTTVCIRSLMQDYYTRYVEAQLGRKITIEEGLYVAQRIGEITGEPQCYYCYVAADRMAFDEALGRFVKDELEPVFKAYDEGKTLEEAVSLMSDEYHRGKRAKTSAIRKRVAYWYAEAKAGRRDRLTAKDLAGVLFRDEDIAKRRAELPESKRADYDYAVSYARSASHAKKRVDYAAYKGDVIKLLKDSNVRSLNNEYGLRMYSFSDFSPAFILENMQMVTDASVRGLKMLGYTKEMDFARIFAPTGMNINLSIFGYEQNGEIGEDAMIGAQWAEAQALRAEHDNVGIIFVATSDTLVNWAMEQEWIDVVIPYHTVFSGGGKVAQIMQYADYKAEQADKKVKPKADSIEGLKPDKVKSIAPPEHQNDMSTYIRACERHSLIPRFTRFINGWSDYQSGTISLDELVAQNPNYMKLVNETRRSAGNTPTVQPKFDVAAAEESLRRLASKGGYAADPFGSVDETNAYGDEIAEAIRARTSEQLSERDPGQQTADEILSNPFEDSVTTEAQREALKRYQTKLAKLQGIYSKIAELETDVAAAEGDKKRKIANRIGNLNRQAVNLRAQLNRSAQSNTLAPIIKEERRKGYDRLTTEQRKQFNAAYRTVYNVGYAYGSAEGTAKAEAKAEAKAKKELEKELKKEQRTTAKLLAERDRLAAKAKRESYALGYGAGAKAEHERYVESLKTKTATKKVLNEVAKLEQMLVTNTDKLHVPEAFKKDVKAFLSTIIYAKADKAKDPRNAIALAAEKLQEQIAQSQMVDSEEPGKSDLSAPLDMPPDFAERMKAFIMTIQSIAAERIEIISTGSTGAEAMVIDSLNTDELNRLYEIVRDINRGIRGINKLYYQRQFASVRESAEQSINELENVNQGANKLTKFTDWDNGVPYYVFGRMGAGIMDSWWKIAEGFDKFAFGMERISADAAKLWTPDQLKEWEKKPVTIKLNKDGDKASMTVAQAMYLYLLSKRATAQPHLLLGGFKVKDTGKLKLTTREANTTYHITYDALFNIAEQIPAEAVAVADRMQRYMADEGARLGNEVSMIRWGYEFFGQEKDYVPMKAIPRDKTDSIRNTQSILALAHMSFTNSLTPNANNALSVDSMFNVWTEHMTDMTKYNSLVIPIIDAVRVMKYSTKEQVEGGYDVRSVQNALQNAYGPVAYQYFRNMILSINGDYAGGIGITEALPRTMLRNYKRAQVLANARVVWLQPTSYLRAAAEINPKYLAVGAAKSATQLRKSAEECKKRCGIMAWKSLGFHDTNTSSSLAGIIRQEDTMLDKVLDGTGKGAEIADTITWAALWEAVKAEQREKKPAEKSYEQACEDRFREVIYATQVVDSPLARSQAMRNTSVYSQMLTAFGSEPTLSFNMVRHAVLQYQADVQRLGKEAARSKHRNKLLAVFAAYVGTAALSAVVESFFDAIRDDDDETFLRKFSEAFIGRWEPGKGFWANAGSFAFSNFASNLSPFTKLPIVRDIVSLMEGYDTERTELMGVKSTIKAAQIGLEFFRVKTGRQENYTKTTYYGNMTVYGAISVALKALSQGVGVPFYAVTRDVVSAWNVVARTFGWEQIKSYDSESEASKAYRGSDEALDKYTEKTISDKAAKLMADGASEAEALEEGARYVATQMRALIKDGYITGALTVEEATKQLVEIGGQTEDEAYWKIKEWDSGRKDYSKYDSLEAAIRADSRQSYASAFHELTTHGVDDKTARTQATKIIHEMYDEGILSDDATIRLLTEYAGKDTEAAERTINSW